MNLETIVYENKTLKIIDQRLLPQRLVYIELKNLQDALNAISELKVRGAPAIGITAAYAFFLHTHYLWKARTLNDETVNRCSKLLKEARPTAVNLSWAVEEMLSVYREFKGDSAQLLLRLEEKALSIHEQDRVTCRKIGEAGSTLLSQKARILTHCNAGALATGGTGTALAVIYQGFDSGKEISVFVDETRPVGQGARLTYWELSRYGVPATLIADNMAASLMQKGHIDAVIVGADRIARNGDVANKIGTYGLAVLAAYHHVPFYVAAPLSTFDFQLNSGAQIPIEFRADEEILSFWKIPPSAEYRVYNPAFDVTPNSLITNIITDKGVLEKPFKRNIEHLIH